MDGGVELEDMNTIREKKMRENRVKRKKKQEEKRSEGERKPGRRYIYKGRGGIG